MTYVAGSVVGPFNDHPLMMRGGSGQDGVMVIRQTP